MEQWHDGGEPFLPLHEARIKTIDSARFCKTPLHPKRINGIHALMSAHGLDADSFLSVSPLECNTLIDMVTKQVIHPHYPPEYKQMTRFLVTSLGIDPDYVRKIISARNSRNRYSFKEREIRQYGEDLNYIYWELPQSTIDRIRSDLQRAEVNWDKVKKANVSPKEVYILTRSFINLPGVDKKEQSRLLKRYLRQVAGKSKPFIAAMNIYEASLLRVKTGSTSDRTITRETPLTEQLDHSAQAGYRGLPVHHYHDQQQQRQVSPRISSYADGTARWTHLPLATTRWPQISTSNPSYDGLFSQASQIPQLAYDYDQGYASVMMDPSQPYCHDEPHSMASPENRFGLPEIGACPLANGLAALPPSNLYDSSQADHWQNFY